MRLFNHWQVKEKMSYSQAISLLTSQKKFRIKLGLERVLELLKLLNNPQENIKIIHVAGTNGKGSTCAMLESVLRHADYKTGLYTSPHLVDYTERIKINNNEIAKEQFADLIFKIIKLSKDYDIAATEFEILTVAAFEYFDQNNVDIVLLETGLGGRLDATNVITKPILSIITSISLDHTDRLGDTIEKIAFEKAGIIKRTQPVVVSKLNKGLNIIKEIAQQKNSKVLLSDCSDYELDKFKIKTPEEEYELPLLGYWQMENLSVVLESVNYLSSIGFNISLDMLKQGLKNVKWSARMQYLQEKNILLDGAHNESAATLLRKSLDFYFPNKKIVWVYSSLNTKNYKSIIKKLFKRHDKVICTNVPSAASVEPYLLKKDVLSINPKQEVYEKAELEAAIKLAISINTDNEDSLCVIAGSFYTIGYVLPILLS